MSSESAQNNRITLVHLRDELIVLNILTWRSKKEHLEHSFSKLDTSITSSWPRLGEIGRGQSLDGKRLECYLILEQCHYFRPELHFESGQVVLVLAMPNY